MRGEISGTAVPELKGPETKPFQDIKPERPMPLDEIRKDLYGRMQEQKMPDLETSQESFKHIPHKDVDWNGTPGDSMCRPDPDTERGKVLEELKKYKQEGVEYKNGEPDFSPYSVSTVEIDHMTDNRYSTKDPEGNRIPGNYEQADIRCADLWNEMGREGKTDWTPRDVKNWRKENQYTWHERQDLKTMDLVPRSIHSFFTHPGGVSVYKETHAAGGIHDV